MIHSLLVLGVVAVLGTSYSVRQPADERNTELLAVPNATVRVLPTGTSNPAYGCAVYRAPDGTWGLLTPALRIVRSGTTVQYNEVYAARKYCAEAVRAVGADPGTLPLRRQPGLWSVVTPKSRLSPQV